MGSYLKTIIMNPKEKRESGLTAGFLIAALTAKKTPRKEYCAHVSKGGDLVAQTRKMQVVFGSKVSRKKRQRKIEVLNGAVNSFVEENQPQDAKRTAQDTPYPITLSGMESSPDAGGISRKVEVCDMTISKAPDILGMLGELNADMSDCADAQKEKTGQASAEREATCGGMPGERSYNTPKSLSAITCEGSTLLAPVPSPKASSRPTRIERIRTLVDEVLGTPTVQPKRSDREERKRKALGVGQSNKPTVLTAETLSEALGEELAGDLGEAVSRAFDVEVASLDRVNAALIKVFQVLTAIPVVKRSGAMKRAEKPTQARICEINGGAR